MSTKGEWLERLAYKRDELLASLDGLSEAGWGAEVWLGWTAKDVLAHVAAWETRVAEVLPRLLADQGMRIVGVEPDSFNAEQVALRRDRTPRELLDELADSRWRIEEALAGASDDDLTRPRAVPCGQIVIEGWALQEIYEHDGEHAAQLRAWRAAHPEVGRSLRDTPLDDMAAQRAGLLFACLGLDGDTLASTPVMDNYAIKDILAHIAAWDDVHTERAELALAGREVEIASVDLDERNAELFAQRRDWPLEQALQAALESRQRWLEVFEAATLEQLVRPLHLPWRETSMWEFAWWRARHDAVHTKHVNAWRGPDSSLFSPGPRSLLLAAFVAARDDLLRQIERALAGERDTPRLIGDWTLKDLVGHMADWDLFALEALQAMQESRPLPYVAESDVDELNARQIAVRREHPWDQVWAHFQNARAELMDVLADWDEAQLAREVDYPYREWGRTAYGWVVAYAWHDREHADALRT